MENCNLITLSEKELINRLVEILHLISEEKIPIITFNNFSEKDYISYNGETFL